MDYSEFKDEEKQDEGLLSKLSEIIENRNTAEEKVIELEAQLEAAKSVVKNIDNNIIPTLLDGIEGDLTLPDGRVVSVKEQVRGSIKSDMKYAGYRWLEEHGHGSLIKKKMTLEFGRNQQELAQLVQEKLSSEDFGQPLNIQQESTVHASTLSAFVRQQLSEGVDLPSEYFSIFRTKKVSVKG